jgi:hypothetical protein
VGEGDDLVVVRMARARMSNFCAFAAVKASDTLLTSDFLLAPRLDASLMDYHCVSNRASSWLYIEGRGTRDLTQDIRYDADRQRGGDKRFLRNSRFILSKTVEACREGMCPYLGSGSIRTRRITPRPSDDGGGRVVGHIYVNERQNYLSRGEKPKLSFVDRPLLVDGVETQ